MTGPDLVNGLFEMLGGIMCWRNVRKILKDKQIKGVCWSSVAFFASWGWWNCFYYPALAQMFSFYAAIFLTLGNSTWAVLAAYYQFKKKI